MGYFSNGCEGADYQERYCLKCSHWSEEKGCPVWSAHFLYNYDAQKKGGETANSILSMLIPLTKDGLSNEQCEMFLPTPESSE